MSENPKPKPQKTEGSQGASAFASATVVCSSFSSASSGTSEANSPASND